MVLVSFVLVVVAAITLVIGLLQSGLSIIYVSIACSLLAGIVLFTAVLRGRPAPSGVGGPVSRPAPQGPSPGPAPAAEWSAPAPAPAPSPSPEPSPEPVPVGAGATATAVEERDDRTEALDRDEIADAVAARDDFPIHDYDSLRATEVLPMLAELSDEQLAAVKDREEGGKNRLMILNRIDSEMQRRGADESTSDAWKVDEADWEPEPGPGPAPEPQAAPLFNAARAEPAGSFPIDDYDDLKALEVLGRLSDLSVTELQVVRQREEDGLRRAMVLNRIDRLVEEAPPPPVPAPAKRRAPARTAKAAATKRGAAPVPASAPAKTPAVKRQARAAKAAPTPPADLSPRARKAAPARAVPAKKAPKAAQVREVPAPRAPRAAKKTAATKSTVAKKTTTARKATKKR